MAKNPETDNIQTVNVAKKKKKRYWWRYLLTFIGGGLFFIGATAGSLIFIGYKVPTKQILQVIGVDPSVYLTEEYQNKTLYSFVVDLATGKIDFNNLNDVGEITPYLSTLISQVNDTLESTIGARIDFSSIGEISWSELGSALIEQVKSSVTIAKLINANESSEKVIQYLCFPTLSSGEYDYQNPYNLKYLLENSSSLLDNAKLGNLVDVGTSGVLYNLRDIKVMNLATEVQALKINQLIDIPAVGESGYNKALSYLGGYTASDISTAINEATVGDLFDCSDTSSMLYQLKDKHLNELDSTLTLGDVLEIDETDPTTPKILITLKNVQLIDLASRFNTLTLGDCMSITSSSLPILQELENVVITSDGLESAFNNLTLETALNLKEDESPKILWALKDNKINAIDNNVINAIQLGDIFSTEQVSSSKILSSLITKGTTIGNISTKMSELTLKDVVEIDSSNVILYSLKDSKIDDLPQKISDLTVSQRFSTTQLATGFLHALPSDTKISEIGTAIESLAFVDVFEDLVYVDPSATPKVLNSTWSYLLDNPNTPDDTPDEYKLTSDSMSNMINNLKANVNIKTLRQLKNDGFFDIADATLDKMLGSKKVGEYTMAEFIDAVDAVLI